MHEESQHPDRDASKHRSEADRPNLAINESRNGRGAIIAFTVAGVVAMAWLVLSVNEAPDAVIVKEEPYRVSGNAGQPYIATPKPEPVAPVQPPQPVPPAPTQQQTQLISNNDLLQREAIRIAREKQARLQERLQSKQVIVANAGDTSRDGVSGSASGGSLAAGSDDDNTNFAMRNGSADYETKKAVQLNNLHALVSQGTIIPGILETAISSNLPGFTRATVAEDVYSFNGEALLIPKGTLLIGRYRSATVQGQDRVFVIWQRLLRPDGVSMELDSYGADSLGRSGLGGEVDTHFFERFGSTIMLSLINGAIQYGVNSANDQNGQTVALNSGQDFSRAAEIALENSINIPPTIHIDQGERIDIFVGHDLDFSSGAKKDVKIVR